jgi:predicted small secreted protein
MCASVQSNGAKRRNDAGRNQGNTSARHKPRFYERISKMIKRIFATLLATLFFGGVFGTLSGCNTMEGAGKDIQKGGKAITDEAREQKEKR